MNQIQYVKVKRNFKNVHIYLILNKILKIILEMIIIINALLIIIKINYVKILIVLIKEENYYLINQLLRAIKLNKFMMINHYKR